MVVSRVFLAEFGKSFAYGFAETQSDTRFALCRPRENSRAAGQFFAEIEDHIASAFYRRRDRLVKPYLENFFFKKIFGGSYIPIRRRYFYRKNIPHVLLSYSYDVADRH